MHGLTSPEKGQLKAVIAGKILSGRLIYTQNPNTLLTVERTNIK